MRPVCLITGAGGQFGSALCVALGDRFDLIAAYRSTPPPISSQLKRLIGPTNKDATRAHCVQADLTKHEDIRRLVEVGMAKYGRIDALINAAADVKFYGRLVELSNWELLAVSQMALNCISPMTLISTVYEHCWKNWRSDNRKWNRNVINVSSMSGLYAYDGSGQAIYSASKAALNMLTLHLALELAPYAVRANAICPGKLTTCSSMRSVIQRVETLLLGSDTGMVISDF
jgi:NAD(P)-dependent dehydrogenase (short-subunit alcohol dehydrogenase family)